MNHEQLYKAPVGFSADQQCLTGMLWRMAGAEDGIRNALTRYTSP
jgi:hypothetical protein